MLIVELGLVLVPLGAENLRSRFKIQDSRWILVPLGAENLARRGLHLQGVPVALILDHMARLGEAAPEIPDRLKQIEGLGEVLAGVGLALEELGADLDRGRGVIVVRLPAN